MANITIPHNDKGYVITFTLQDSTGAALNLAGYTVTFRMWMGDSTTNKVSTACTVTNAAGGVCTWLIAAADTDTPGIYNAVLALTASGVEEKIIPFAVEIKKSN